MARQKIIQKKSTTHYKGYSVNQSYDLNQTHLDHLVTTLHLALEHYPTVTAVRLDFSIKKLSHTDECVEASSDNIQECFQKLLNRLNKQTELKMLMNWKLERSQEKGLHIHTVFYFSYEKVKTFTTKGEFFKYLLDTWKGVTGTHGSINICEGGLADNDNTFSTNKTSQYTVLGKLETLQINNEAYHQQKNLFEENAGFFHWISYLAKTSQKASQRKTFGTRWKTGVTTIFCTES